MRLTSTHTKEPEVVETMSADEDLAKLSGWVSGCIKTYFPSVYDRFAKADPGQENPTHPFRCWYGIFPLFCLKYATNLPVHRLQVHCLEHVDYGNVTGGVCAVLAYGDFDSTKSPYLIFHDLKLVIEFPAGTLALYPSFLLAHSNVSLVEVDSKEDASLARVRSGAVWYEHLSHEFGMMVDHARSSLKTVWRK
ncbi:hypothetical protein NBRC10513_006568 [Rhodotorula toruloides]